MNSVAEVIARMAAIDKQLPDADGVACFNELYLAVTRAVDKEVATATFEDPEFLAALDCDFAQLYFDAVDAPGRSRAWAPLFDARKKRGIAPIQFALAGMNAHINHDLALALGITAKRRKVKLDRDSPQHRDFVRVNALLERVEKRIKKKYATGLIGVADEALGRLDDVVAMWNVARARDAAWTHAEILSSMRVSFLREGYLLTLSRTVGLAGRGLLIPVL
jgi:hypothetical protein